jgi:hypothetical protein
VNHIRESVKKINKKELNVQLLSLAARGKRDLTIEVKNRPGRTNACKRDLLKGKKRPTIGAKET